MQLIIGTHNADKVREFGRILLPLGIEVLSAKLTEAEETGKTFAENAYLKAAAACRETGKPAVSDDSGLAVDALHGAPGIYSARYAGPSASGTERNAKLLCALQDIPSGMRTARFVCAICCVFPNGTVLTSQGECEGNIAYAPRGSRGFGYDPVFLFGEKTFAELTAQEKDLVSHRGKALREFAEKIKTYKELLHAEQ